MEANSARSESIGLSDVPPVDDNERLYRRLPPGWFKGGRPAQIPQRCFMPRPWVSEVKPGDVEGLSLSRAALTDIATASTRPDTGKRMHLAEIGVCDVQRVGMSVQAKPLPENRGHAMIPEMNSLDRRDPTKEARMEECALALSNAATIVYEAPIELQ